MKHASFKFIITFAAFAYAFMVANTFAHEWEDFKMGFLYGSGAADKNDSKLAGEVYIRSLLSSFLAYTFIFHFNFINLFRP